MIPGGSGRYGDTGPLPKAQKMRRIVRYLRKLGFSGFEVRWLDVRDAPAGEPWGYLITFTGAAPISMGTSCAKAMDWIDARKQEAP